MGYKKGLIEKYKETLKGTEWYHQRFDGSPQFLGMAGFPHFFKEERKPKGTHFTDLLIIYTGGTADWHINMGDIERIAQIFIEKSKIEDHISKNLIAKWQEDEKRFYKKCAEVEKTDLRQLSQEELLNLYEDFKKVYQSWFSMTSIIDGFALGTDEFINNELNKFLSTKGIEKGRGKIFSTLTAPTETSFVGEEEISLLKLAVEIEKAPALKEVFRKNETKEIMQELRKYPSVLGLLKEHQQNHFWVKNNYIDGRVLQVEDFILELEKLFVGGGVDVKERLKETQNQVQENKKQKQKLIEELGLPKQLQNLLEISEDFTTWQDQRKKSTFFTTHYVSLILAEVAKRTGCSLEQLKFFMPREVMNLLSGDGYWPSRQEADSRIDYSVFYYFGREDYDFYSGDEARKQVGDILQREEHKEVNDFRGMTACPGRVKGRVKVLKSVKEVSKIEKGEILVAVMTRPDYMVAIKKAAAIVTDEGGITCHAAIVSRELGIPCVIGTKIATQVLRDGDMVEVNANHAIVKIVK